MQTVIYLDLLILSNTVINFLLLSATEHFLSVIPSARSAVRQLLAALVGGVYALAILLPGGVLTFLSKWAVGILMVWIAYGYRCRAFFLKANLLFLLVSTLFAGLMMALWYFAAPPGMVYQNGIAYFAISPLFFIAAAVLCYLAALAISYLTKSKLPVRGDELLLVTVRLEGRKVILIARMDTGNTLCDLFTGAPVVVGSYRRIRPLLSPELDLAVQSILKGDRSMTSLPAAGFRMIPIHTLSGTGLLPAIRPDSMLIEYPDGSRKETLPVYLAISEGAPLPDDCDLLLNPRLEESPSTKEVRT